MPTSREHWEHVYEQKAPDRVSWYRPHLETSVAFIERVAARTAAIIDVGGGAATLVDDLMQRGYEDVTVLDLSRKVLELVQARLGGAAATVHWLEGDVLTVELEPARYDLWHDRAVFHFLTDTAQRGAYVSQVQRAVRKGGHVVVATFGPHGPDRCSGLPVTRYDADGIHAEFGPAFVKLDSHVEQHQTPWGSEQEFVYCYCRVA